ncbi:DNA-3-methyladenine glycosylase family protein [Protaetiibacter intestinalis]|uniref:DNA-3-methyladenine glycosylase 2 family protein n=1 Tax=Protaetiibacter intestinalis TaxID=2419774 RepID=A0A387B2M9_9MICO|nr:DNA-3-methyladenine glycosylase 2 family protein [Protaetiibacter intestinalis]AYF97772.1 DNA-3-methyladenine glycosylase 2 family protein [Protaetiibacter intestinalis]
MDPVVTRYAPPHPVRLRLVLAPLVQGATDPTARRTADGWWLTARFAAGAATLLLRERADGVEARAWGPGAEQAIASVPALLGAEDDDSGFEPGRHPLVARLHHETPGLRLARAGRILPYLVPTVLGQKVTGIEQKSAWRQLVTRYGEAAPGPAPLGMRVVPEAAVWRRIPSWVWHRAGVGPQRSDTLMRVFAVADALERGAVLPGAEAGRRLRTVAGVGPWTVAETLQRSHGDPDAVSVGDLHLCKRVGTALAGRRVDDDGMLELLEPWRGHRQRVVRLIEAAGIGYERHGPRLAIPEHRAR